MKSSTRAALIVAVVLIVAGAVIVGGSLLTGNSFLDLFSSRAGKMETNTYPVSDPFTSVSVTDTVSDIRFEQSKAGECRVECVEDSKLKHVVTVENGVLTVLQKDERRWSDHIGMFTEPTSVTIYMPGGEYDSLNVKTDTGDVDVPADFSFGTLRIESDTADIACLAGASESAEFATDTGDIRIGHTLLENLKMKTDTGRITIESVSLSGGIQISSRTGSVGLTDITCSGADITTTTGRVTLTRCLISGKLDIETDTGDVLLDAADADEIEIDTDTGDVTGTLLSEKIFFVESNTGKIEVPRSMTGGPCEIETSTGDVKISVAEGS